MTTAIVDWRPLPTAEQVRAHQRRTHGTPYGWGRWLCEATGEAHALGETDGMIWIQNWEGDWDRADGEYATSRWLPVGKNGLPQEWP